MRERVRIEVCFYREFALGRLCRWRWFASETSEGGFRASDLVTDNAFVLRCRPVDVGVWVIPIECSNVRQCLYVTVTVVTFVDKMPFDAFFGGFLSTLTADTSVTDGEDSVLNFWVTWVSSDEMICERVS